MGHKWPPGHKSETPAINPRYHTFRLLTVLSVTVITLHFSMRNVTQYCTTFSNHITDKIILLVALQRFSDYMLLLFLFVCFLTGNYVTASASLTLYSMEVTSIYQ